MPDDEPDGTETEDDREMIRLGSHVEFCVMPMVRNLAAVEQRGFRLDQQWVADRLDAVEDTVEEASFDLAERYELGDEAEGLDISWAPRSEEHTSELQSLMRISYAVFCLTKKQ